MKKTLALTALLVCVGSAQADPFKPGFQDQVKVGQQAAQQLRSQKDVKVLSENDPRVREIRRVGASLVAKIPAAERKELPFNFTFDVIDSKDVNAFALPGGPIFFYTGLLDRLKTEDEVAGILGHELTHIRREHWAKQYSDETKRSLGLLLLLSALRANKEVVNIAAAANDVLFSLRYSRDHESEADTVGYELMTSDGYNPQGMADVFTILSSLGNGGAPEFLSDHPDSGKRAKTIEARIASSNQTFPPQRPRFSAGSRRYRGGNESTSAVAWDADGWPTLR